MLLQFVTSGESPRALEYKLYVQLFPRETQRIAIAQEPQLSASNDQVFAVDNHGIPVPPVNCVEAEEISDVLDIPQVVDGHQLH